MLINHPPCFEQKSAATQLNLRSSAKINLFLKITGKRPDGYHLLFTLMSPIGLYDTITIETQTSQFKITCDHPLVPEDASNIALRAARAILKELEIRFKVSLGAVAIHLEKNIPVGAGLGGGSSNAAAVLLGLNQYYGNPLSLDALMKIGLTLGADVPFFLFGRPAIARGIGEILEVYDRINPYKILLVYPGFAISTATVYKNLNLRLTNSQKEINYLSFKNENFCPRKHLCNDLESSVVALYPELIEIKETLKDLGARGALMSGSGSTIFGIFSETKLAQEAHAALGRQQRWQIYLTDLLV